MRAKIRFSVRLQELSPRKCIDPREKPQFPTRHSPIYRLCDGGIYEAGCYTGTGWRPPSGMRRVELGQGTELREIFNWPNPETGQSLTNPAVILPVTVGRS